MGVRRRITASGTARYEAWGYIAAGQRIYLGKKFSRSEAQLLVDEWNVNGKKQLDLQRAIANTESNEATEEGGCAVRLCGLKNCGNEIGGQVVEVQVPLGKLGSCLHARIEVCDPHYDMLKLPVQEGAFRVAKPLATV